MTEVIREFRGDYDFLSNFFQLTFKYDGEFSYSAEHHFQAAKTLDKDARWSILTVASPGLAKQLGRRVPLRSDWELIKNNVMRDIVRAKFRLPVLKYMLLSTEDAILQEGNNWGDRYWGMVNGVGENHLGKILMKVREELAFDT